MPACPLRLQSMSLHACSSGAMQSACASKHLVPYCSDHVDDSLHGGGLDYFREHLPLHAPSRNLSFLDALCVVPKTRTRLGELSFNDSGIIIWISPSTLVFLQVAYLVNPSYHLFFSSHFNKFTIAWLIVTFQQKWAL